MTYTHRSADEVKKIYTVKGHFYTLNIGDKMKLGCRSVLEITSKEADASEQADAIFVMMNPGSSKPLWEDESVRVAGEPITMLAALVPTIPDTTQYQLMRMMLHQGWRYIRVLNLSDIRSPDSGFFEKTFTKAEQYPHGKAHSIFSSGRRLELLHYLKRKPEAAVIRAWGVSSGLTPLTTRAALALKAEPYLSGWPKAGASNKFFHPLPPSQPKQKEWVVQTISHLSKLRLTCP